MKVFSSKIPANTAIVDAIKKGVQKAAKKETPTLSAAQFLNWIKESKGALLVGIESLTDSKARKTNNPFGKILKRARFVGLIGGNYEKSVNNEMERQDAAGEFKAEPLSWGEWDVVNKIIIHKGEYYIRTQSSPGQRKKSKAKILDYRNEDGQILSREKVAPFLPEKADSARQSEVGLAEKVEVRTFSIKSIRKVRISGVTYKLIHS